MSLFGLKHVPNEPKTIQKSFLAKINQLLFSNINSMAFYYFEQIKQIENKLNTMQNKPKMQLTFGFYYQKMYLKIMKK